MRTRIRSGVAAVAVVAAAVGLVHYVTNDRPARASSQAVPVVTGCVIRFEATGPKIYANSTHLCTGARSVSVDGDGDLVITSAPHGPIISMTAEEDETLSRRGILAGPSGGVGRTVVRFYSTKTGAAVRADSPVLQGSYSNLWMTWINAG